MSQPIFYWCTENDDISELAQGIESALAAQSKSLLILACSSEITTKDFDPILTAIKVPVCGGVYPLLVCNDRLFKQGFIVVGYSSVLAVSNISQLSRKVTYIEGLELILESDKNLSSYTNFLMFYDALCPAEEFVDCFYDCFGSTVTVVGGGAGMADFSPLPCVITNDGLKSDIVQLVGLSNQLYAGVAHGWEVLKGPYLITEAVGSLVKSINYRSAKDFYQTIVEDLSGLKFKPDDFYKIAKNYPLGITGLNGEILVRDPVKVQGDSVQFVANVPVNSMVSILKAKNESLISSARAAVIKACEVPDEHAANVIIFDCISRVLYMADDFQLELSEINNSAPDNAIVFGGLSLGEVANNQSGSIRVLNKSTVIGRF
ncbi:MAG: FIST C-terminal domain-containing protein [Gammaproteobacteria bacterium]|nr:FIST C-terminal domain-containing protein [Gammaproteobacteria bacterium]